MAKSVRARYWATIIYQESAPVDFVSRLENAHVFFLLSPLHAADVDDTGNVKKPHWHLMLCFDGPTSDAIARDIFMICAGVGCERIASATAYARYLCHLDNPDKAQYSSSGVRACGVDYESFIATADSRYSNIGAVLHYCTDNNIRTFSGLLLSLVASDTLLFKTVCDNAYLIRSFLRDLSKGQDAASLEGDDNA